MSLALALDLGTTSIAAVAVDEEGRLVAHVQLPNDAAVTGLPAGYAEQNPVRIREVAWQVLQRLAAVLPDTPHCLGLTGQMHGGLVVDAKLLGRDVLAGQREEREVRLEPPCEHREPGDGDDDPQSDVHQAAACDQTLMLTRR